MRIIAALLLLLAFLPARAQVSKELLKKSREARKQMEKIMDASPSREYPKIEKACERLDTLLSQILAMGDHQELPLDSLLGGKKYMYVSGTSDGHISSITYYTNNGGSYHMLTSWARIEHPDGTVGIYGPYDFFPSAWEYPAAGVYIGTGMLHTCNSCHSYKIEIWKNDATTGRLQPSKAFKNPYTNLTGESFTVDTRMGNMIRAFEWNPDSLLLTLEFLHDDLSSSVIDLDPQVHVRCLFQWKFDGETFDMVTWQVPGLTAPEGLLASGNTKELCDQAREQLSALLSASPWEEEGIKIIDKNLMALDTLIPQILEAGNWKTLPLSDWLGEDFTVSGSEDARITVIAFYTNNGGTWQMYHHFMRMENDQEPAWISGPLDFAATGWFQLPGNLYLGTGASRTCSTCESYYCELWGRDISGMLRDSGLFMIETPNRQLKNGYGIDVRMGNMLRAFEWNADSLVLTLEYIPDDLSGGSLPEDELAEVPPVRLRWHLEEGVLRLMKED